MAPSTKAFELDRLTKRVVFPQTKGSATLFFSMLINMGTQAHPENTYKLPAKEKRLCNVSKQKLENSAYNEEIKLYYKV